MPAARTVLCLLGCPKSCELAGERRCCPPAPTSSLPLLGGSSRAGAAARGDGGGLACSLWRVEYAAL